MLENIASPVAESLVYLCRCAVNQETADKEKLKNTDLDELYKLASRHMLAAITGLALQSAGLCTEDFAKAISRAYWKTMILDTERSAVCEKLNEAGIWYVPLKGSVIKDWYPQFGMRESADCDILFDKGFEEQVRDIMLGLGYTVESYGAGHHDVYFKEPVTNMQMHVDLFGEGYEARLNDYYCSIRERLLPKTGSELEFRPEDLYLYLLSHEWEHFQKAGTGLRSILDTFVLLQQYETSLDWPYIEKEAQKIGIGDFETRNRMLAHHLFGSGSLSDSDREMLRYVLDSGVHGTYVNRVQNDVQKLGGGLLGRIKYFFRRFFLPEDLLKRKYPFFWKHRILLPVLPLYRIVSSLSKGNIQKELKSVQSKRS